MLSSLVDEGELSQDEPGKGDNYEKLKVEDCEDDSYDVYGLVACGGTSSTETEPTQSAETETTETTTRLSKDSAKKSELKDYVPDTSIVSKDKTVSNLYATYMDISDVVYGLDTDDEIKTSCADAGFDVADREIDHNTYMIRFDYTSEDTVNNLLDELTSVGFTDQIAEAAFDGGHLRMLDNTNDDRYSVVIALMDKQMTVMVCDSMVARAVLYE